MTTANIRKQLTNYLQIADEKKLKAIYTMVEDEINTNENDWDDDFVKELKKRSSDFVNGKTKSYSWDEVKTSAIKKLKTK